MAVALPAGGAAAAISLDASSAGVDAQALAAPELPRLETPKLPSVPSPKLPDVPQLPSTPKLQQGPSGGGLPGLPSGSGGGGGGIAGGSPGAGSTDSTPGSSGSADAGSGPATGPSASGGEAAGGGSGASTSRGANKTSSAAAERRATRELATDVERLEGCLPVLSALERPVIVMRAGVGGEPRASRNAVARRLDVKPARVERIEHRALGKLRTAARSGACGGDAGATTIDTSAVPPLVSPASASTLPALVPASALANDDPRRSGGGEGTPGVRASAQEAGIASPASVGGAPADRSGSPFPQVVLIALVVAAFLGGVLALSRRRTLAAAGAGGGPVSATDGASPAAPYPTNGASAEVAAGPNGSSEAEPGDAVRGPAGDGEHATVAAPAREAPVVAAPDATTGAVPAMAALAASAERTRGAEGVPPSPTAPPESSSRNRLRVARAPVALVLSGLGSLLLSRALRHRKR